MGELPASVRLALWVTSSWHTPGTLSSAARRALPDIDSCGLDIAILASWREVGETQLLAAMPYSGSLGLLTGAPAAAIDAAIQAQECLIAPSLGAVLVPTWSTFGPEHCVDADLDTGVRLDWTSFQCDPIPPHQVAAFDARAARRQLIDAITGATTDLMDLGAQPFDPETTWSGVGAAAQWALPDGIPAYVREAITLAGTVYAAADSGLAARDDSLNSYRSGARAEILAALKRAAAQALVEATGAASSSLAHSSSPR